MKNCQTPNTVGKAGHGAPTNPSPVYPGHCKCCPNTPAPTILNTVVRVKNNINLLSPSLKAVTPKTSPHRTNNLKPPTNNKNVYVKQLRYIRWKAQTISVSKPARSPLNGFHQNFCVTSKDVYISNQGRSKGIPHYRSKRSELERHINNSTWHQPVRTFSSYIPSHTTDIYLKPKTHLDCLRWIGPGKLYRKTGYVTTCKL